MKKNKIQEAQDILKKYKEQKNKELAEMLDLGLHGEFEKAEKIGIKWLNKEPGEPHFSFNLAWYAAMHGDLLTSHQLLDRGRDIQVFGDSNPMRYSLPIWDGETNGLSILLYTEGGLGDQIIYSRFAKDIAARGNKVILCCDPRLIPILKDLEGVSAIIPREGANYIYVDAWVPAMSSISCLKYQFKDISGKPYIKRNIKDDSEPHRFRIGLKWSGNPKYEHEQHRKWDFKYLLDLIEPLKDKVEFVSLQRDEEKELKPDWVKDVELDTFEDTRKAISDCDMVITSCTSIAHLAGAMGVDTRVIVPALSYYVWALPGDKSPYYDSVKLYRQIKYGTWQEPFEKLKQDLNKELFIN